MILITLLGAIIAVQFLTFRYRFDDNKLYFKNSFIIKTEFSISFDKISLISYREAVWSRPFHAVKLQIESEAKSIFNKKKSSDVTLFVDIATAKRILYRFGNVHRSDTKDIRPASRPASYRNPKAFLLLFSVFFSSAASGGIYLLFFLYQSTDIFADTLGFYYRDVVEQVSSLAAMFFEGFSNGLALLFIIIAGGWLYSFAANILRLQNYRLTVREKIIEIRGGYFSRWSYYINRKYVAFTDIKQNLLMKILGLYSVNIGCTGYGKKRGEIPVFIPITAIPKTGSAIERIIPDFSHRLDNKKLKFSTAKTAIFKLSFIALILVIGFAALFILMLTAFPNFLRLLLFLLIMTEIPSVLYLAACVREGLSSGIGVDNGQFTVYCRKGFSEHMVIIPENMVSTIAERKSFLMKKRGLSNITFTTGGESGVKHRIRSVKAFDFGII
ncbi:MAG: PH domain-containing protein [Ruminococcus sp.]|nr:PH domain-containing protein [Ruminococcus sp.]